MRAADAARSLESLGNEKRLLVYRALVRAGRSGLPVGKLQKKLGVPASTLSHHLAQLVACGLVSQEREGRILRCRANLKQMTSLVDYLVKECCADEQPGA